jgi:hypothetical protein
MYIHELDALVGDDAYSGLLAQSCNFFLKKLIIFFKKKMTRTAALAQS